MGRWRLAAAKDIKFVNITAMSGVKAFAPDFAKVKEYKQNLLSEEEYTRLYLEKMARSETEYARVWGHLQLFPKMAFACYCKAGIFCHRHLFLPLVKSYLERYGHTVEEMGELKP